MDSINRQNCRLLLAAFLESNGLNVRQVAKAVGCPTASLMRIIACKTQPSDELLKQLGVMMEIGFERYDNLTAAEKETISETIGAIGGGVLGFASISATISSLGAVAGLSAAGVTSGLGALGAIVGGGMVAGVSVAALVPLAAGAVGYALIKGIKYLIGESKLDASKLDPTWEVLPNPQIEGE